MKNKLLLELLPLETTRLIIKPTSKEDIDLLLKLDKQKETQKYLGGIKNKTKEERLLFLDKKELKIKAGLVSSLTVFLKENKIPIAFIGFSIDENLNSAEISYIFDYDYTKKGYCTEVVEKLISIGFENLNLDKIIADMVLGNDNSKKLLTKLGFTKTGIRQEANTTFEEYELTK